MKLSDTQRDILSTAAQHPDHLAYPPERLPAGARQKVAQALLKNDLVIAVHRPAYDAHAKWTVEGEEMLLRLTDAGLRAIGIEPAAAEPTAPTGGEAAAPQAEDASVPEPAQDAPTAPDADEPEEEDDRPRHERLGVDEALIYGPSSEWQQPAGDAALLEQALAERTPQKVVAAARAVLAAWDDEANREGDMIGALDGPMQALRAALAGKPARAPREPGAPRKPREGTKQEAVLAMLRRPEGATVAQIAEATGWAAHTVRGFFAGLKKKGFDVQVLERVRMVGPNKEGAKGSYTVYQLPG